MRYYQIEGDFLKLVLPTLQKEGYTKLHNPTTGGDNDFVIVDTLSKQYAYFEYGYAPYNRDLKFFESQSLQELFSMRRTMRVQGGSIIELLADCETCWFDKGKDFLSIDGASCMPVLLSKSQVKQLIGELQEIENSLK